MELKIYLKQQKVFFFISRFHFSGRNEGYGEEKKKHEKSFHPIFVD